MDHRGRAWSGDQEDRLRGLSLADARTIRDILAIDPDATSTTLSASSRTLIDLAALVALGADEVSYGAAAERALAMGGTSAAVADIVVSLAPIVGLARVRDAAESIVLALGTDAEVQRAFVHKVSEGPLQLYLRSA